MGRVICVSIAGLDIWINSTDHVPPHLHIAKPGHWEIRVFILTTTQTELAFEYKWQKVGGLQSKLAKEIRSAVVNHNAELLREWEASRPTGRE